ncbi:MAG: glycosyltransferase family 39 protein [Elusimicrobia bacterium]|nr:glycosyltransferase family 39 protein [Elusimicrobiota bacterium]
MKKRRGSQPSPQQAEASALRVSAPVISVLFVFWLILLGVFYRKQNVGFDPEVWGSFFSILPEAFSRFGAGLFARLAWLAAFWAVAMGLGSLLLRALRLDASGWEAGALAAGLGAGALSIGLFGLGLAVFTPAVMKASFIAAAAVAALSAPWWLRGLPREKGPPAGGALGGWPLAALGLLAVAALMCLLGAMAPEVFYDSLVYHLALPKLYLLRGSIVPTPHNIYSGLPLGVQTLYGLALAISDDRLAALLHASFGLWTAVAVYLIGRRHICAEAGAFAAFAFYLCPAALYASWNCGVDLASSFLCALSLLALLRGLGAEEPGLTLRWALVAGLLAGFAAGTKYNVLPVAAILVLIHAWGSRRLGRPLKDCAAMAGAAALTFSPWLIKNLLFFGNPLYPFLTGIFGGGALIADWKGFLEASGSRNLAQTLSTWAGWKGLLLQPWITSVGDWPLGDWPGPVFILLLPVAFFLRFKSDSERAVAAAAAGGYLAWTLASHLVRYMLPSFPFLALCAALVIRQGVLPRWVRRAAWAAALFAGAFNFQAAFSQGAGIGQWLFLEGRVSKTDYLMTQRVTYGLPYYSAAEFMNRELPRDARVLVLGESRAFYIERDVIAATVFDHNPFWLAVRESKTPEELLSKVRGLGITHIFLSARQLAYREHSPGIFPRDAARNPAYQVFWGKYLRTIFEDRVDSGENARWLSVYEVLEKPNRPSEAPLNPALVVLTYLEGQKKK